MKTLTIETPLGTMHAGAVEQGICLLEFADRKNLEAELASLSKQLEFIEAKASNKHFKLLKLQLGEYFAGKRKEFSIPLFTPGTEFQNLVWKTLQTISYGATTSYKKQAAILENPEAIRAIAHANGMNRIAIIIPCHRVIASDGNLTGYAGGIWRKKWLLDFEKSNLPTSQTQLIF